MAGFIDLSALALIAGYQMNARGMTSMGVQVLGAILNKCVSTADYKWGYRWSDIPKSLQVYGLGDLKFGHLTFIVLTGILVRDLFPDPDVVCQFLNGNQWHAITWFYKWILKSVEGVEVQEQDARNTLTRSQMICALRYRDERSKLSKIPPPFVDSSQDEIVNITLELEQEKELEPEKKKPPAASRSRCLRSTAHGRARKKKPTKKHRIRTQDMIEGGPYWSDESAPESVEVGFLLLGLTQDVIDLDKKI